MCLREVGMSTWTSCLLSLLSLVASSPLCRMGVGEGRAGVCPPIYPGPLAPEPPFPQRGQALGIHVGKVGAAQGETVGAEKEQSPGVGS